MMPQEWGRRGGSPTWSGEAGWGNQSAAKQRALRGRRSPRADRALGLPRWPALGLERRGVVRVQRAAGQD